MVHLGQLSALCRVSVSSIVRRRATRHFAAEIRGSHTMGDSSDLAGLDATQIKLMEEQCILVDKDDNNVGAASKRACHLLENINNGMLHRAFSVFLFNEEGQLLLQQRSTAKITFPDHWTNTCCSHPLNFEAELEEAEAIGVKRAAQRKLQHELGIKPEQVPLEDFQYLTRVHYQSENVPRDGRWGEHEVDYILLIQRDVDVRPNENEVKSFRYVSREELKRFMAEAASQGILVTPWFKLVVDNFLDKWWTNLSHLQPLTDHSQIHRMI